MAGGIGHRRVADEAVGPVHRDMVLVAKDRGRNRRQAPRRLAWPGFLITKSKMMFVTGCVGYGHGMSRREFEKASEGGNACVFQLCQESSAISSGVSARCEIFGRFMPPPAMSRIPVWVREPRRSGHIDNAAPLATAHGSPPQVAKIRRRQDSALGKILTTRVRRRSSSLYRSSMFVDFIRRRCSLGNRYTVSVSST